MSHLNKNSFVIGVVFTLVILGIVLWVRPHETPQCPPSGIGVVDCEITLAESQTLLALGKIEIPGGRTTVVFIDIGHQYVLARGPQHLSLIGEGSWGIMPYSWTDDIIH